PALVIRQRYGKVRGEIESTAERSLPQRGTEPYRNPVAWRFRTGLRVRDGRHATELGLWHSANRLVAHGSSVIDQDDVAECHRDFESRTFLDGYAQRKRQRVFRIPIELRDGQRRIDWRLIEELPRRIIGCRHSREPDGPAARAIGIFRLECRRADNLLEH